MPYLSFTLLRTVCVSLVVCLRLSILFLFARVTLPGSLKILKKLQGIRSEYNDAANHLRTNIRRPR